MISLQLPSRLALWVAICRFVLLVDRMRHRYTSRMKRYVVSFAAVLFCLATAGCIGAGMNSTLTPAGPGQFPIVSGKSLEGEIIELPTHLNGELRVVVLAFEQEQQGLVDTWIEALRPHISARPYVQAYEVPVIYEASAAYRFWINNGMRAGVVSDDARRHVITVYTDREAFFRELGVRRESVTTMLLDRAGAIKWRFDGAMTGEALNGLLAAIAKADAAGASRRAT